MSNLEFLWVTYTLSYHWSKFTFLLAVVAFILWHSVPLWYYNIREESRLIKISYLIPMLIATLLYNKLYGNFEYFKQNVRELYFEYFKQNVRGRYFEYIF